MTYSREQKKIFDKLMKGINIIYQELEEYEMVALSDGVELYLIPKDYLVIDLNCCVKREGIDRELEKAKQGTEYALTNETYVVEFSDRYRQLYNATSGERVWIQEKFAKEHKDDIFRYSGGASLVCAIDYTGDVTGAIMPFDMERKLGSKEE